MKNISTLWFAVLLLLMVIAQIGQAQNPLLEHHTFDKIYLKGGTFFYGKVLNLNDEIVEFEMMNGKIVEFKRISVKKIVQQLNDKAKENFQLKSRPLYNFKETGWYNSTYINLPQGFDIADSWISGMGLHHVFGYQHSRLLGTGVGLGFDGYELGSGRNVLSAYSEIRGYFLQENFSPFYTLGFGYGFALKNTDIGIIESKGGLFFNPAISYRFGGSANANFLLGLGYKIQRATFADRGWNGSVSKQTYTFNRLNVMVGLVF